jgi:hypothetical protein
MNFFLKGIKKLCLNLSKENVHILELNNKQLLKTNEILTDQISELKMKQDLMLRKFEEETSFIRERLDVYKNNLNKICQTVYEGNNFNI